MNSPESLKRRLADDQRLHHIGINIVQFRGKLAALAENARLGALDMMPTRRRRATMTVDALNILAAATV